MLCIQGCFDSDTAVVTGESCAVEKRVVQPIKKISGEVRLPGSKSLSNRALLLAALADGVTVVENLLVRHLLMLASSSCPVAQSVSPCTFVRTWLPIVW